IKFTKRHTAVNVKFILVAEEFVGIRITKSVTVECARTGRGKQSNAVIAKDGRAMEEASNTAEPFAAPAEQSRPDGNISDFGDDFDFDWDEIMEITQNVGTVTVAAEHGQLPTKQQPVQIMDGTSSAGPQTPITPKREPCAHKCARKDKCEHLCCKIGVKSSKKGKSKDTRSQTPHSEPKSAKSRKLVGQKKRRKIIPLGDWNFSDEDDFENDARKLPKTNESLDHTAAVAYQPNSICEIGAHNTEQDGGNNENRSVSGDNELLFSDSDQSPRPPKMPSELEALNKLHDLTSVGVKPWMKVRQGASALAGKSVNARLDTGSISSLGVENGTNLPLLSSEQDPGSSAFLPAMTAVLDDEAVDQAVTLAEIPQEPPRRMTDRVLAHVRAFVSQQASPERAAASEKSVENRQEAKPVARRQQYGEALAAFASFRPELKLVDLESLETGQDHLEAPKKSESPSVAGKQNLRTIIGALFQ
ncbi:hypothetical protein HDU84_000891, partial [Entophlyctis sp. JEL0112]